MKESPLNGKRILVVDDELDVLDTMEEILSMCRVTTAQTFEEARRRIEEEPFDFAILDIMGVDGYELLEIANQKGIPAVMLTAHALNVENTVKSFRKGAAYYVPKEEMERMPTFLEDIIEARESGKSTMRRWLERLTSYYDKQFGPDWKKEHQNFWDNIPPWY